MPALVAPKNMQQRTSPKSKSRAPAKAQKALVPADKPLAHAEIRAIVLGIMLAMFLGALDQTIIATALPTIGRAFRDFENLSWVVTAYLLTATATTPLYGKLSDIYGRRAVMLTGIAIFIAGSVVCAAATSMAMMVAGRALQGLGGGGLMSVTQTIIADIVSPRERGRYQGYIGAVFAASSVGGPVLGGLLTEYVHWSLIFWINLPLGLLALYLTDRVLKGVTFQSRRHSLDVAGALLMMAAAIALLLALNWGGTRYPWLSAPVIGLFVGSAMLWALFSWRLVGAREPFLPLTILANPIVRCATLTGTCAMGTLIGLTIFVPIYFETVLHLSAGQSGLALIPLVAAPVLSSTATGRAMVNVDHYKRMPLAGFALSILSLGALAIWPSGLPLVAVMALFALAGIGIGSVFPVSTVSMQNAVTGPQMGIATGAMNFFRSLGSALVVAMFGAIVLGSIGAASGLSVEEATRTASEPMLAYAFRFVFLAAALVMAFGLAFLVAMEEKPLRGPAAKEPPPPDAAATPVQSLK